MAKVQLIATGKKYGTRHMTAGETLSVRPAEARVLKALGIASDPPSPRAPRKQQSPVPPADAELTALRTDYTVATGKRAYHGWDAARLRELIAEARSPATETPQEPAGE